MKFRWTPDGFQDRHGNPMLSETERAAPVALPSIMRDIPAYRSPVTGQMVDGRSARRDDLARSNCREVDPSEIRQPGFQNEKFMRKHGFRQPKGA